MVNIGNDWDAILGDEFKQEYYLLLRKFLVEEYRNYAVFPDMYDIFNALKLTALADTKAVILGQDPYIKKGEAHGLAFSVQDGVRIPPSLMNVYRELQTDLGCEIPNTGCLVKWARQGVLLLNAVLTVRAGASNSHKGRGWETFTDRVIEIVAEKREPVVFMLWGRNAADKAGLITNRRHLVLRAAHPSPLAQGAFFGCKHFSKANEFLAANGLQPIDWQI